MVTVQEKVRGYNYLGPRRNECPYLEIRIRRTKIGNLKEGDKLEVILTKTGDILLRRRGDTKTGGIKCR